MRDGGGIFNLLNRDPGCLESGDRRFATGTWTLDPHFDVLDPELGGLLSRLLRCTLSCKGCALSRALESAGPRARPAESIPLGVGDGYVSVVEGSFDERDRRRHVATHLATLVVCILVGLLLCHGIKKSWLGVGKREMDRKNPRTIASP